MAKPGVPSSGNGEYAELPEMTFILCKINDKDDAPSISMKQFKEGEEAKEQLKVVFDAIYYLDDEGEKVDVQGSRIWFFGGVSLHEKAKLRGLAIATMPENTTLDVLTDEQAAAKDRAPNLYADFDTDELAGKYVWVIGEFKDAEKKYLKPTGFKRAKVKAQEAAKAPAAPKAEKAKKAASEDIEV